MNLFKKIKGTEDIIGRAAELFQEIERVGHESFARHGFEEIRTPLLEFKSLFVHAIGSGTDVVQKEMYEFVDKSDEVVALRPEGTAGIVRAYIEDNLQKAQGVLKLYYMGPMFRRERPQKGRLRQFHQIGAEYLGSESPYADAETICCMTGLLEGLGIRGYRVKLNNLGTFDERTIYKEKLKEYFNSHKTLLCSDCVNRLEKNVLRILDCKNGGCRSLLANAPRIDAYIQESKGHFEAVLGLLKAAECDYQIEPYMVRGLDYYTKTVFEVTHPQLGAQDALGAGGRYDGLIETLGGQSAGAVGFALGIERLMICLGEKVSGGGRGQSFFLATLGQTAQREAFALAAKIRKAGLSVLMDYSSKSLKGQMRAADKARAAYVIILGDDELSKKVCALKDMKTGSQETLPLDAITQTLKGKVQC